MTKPARAKPGPKPKPASEKVVKKTVSLKPATYKGVKALGGDVLSQGIEIMYAERTTRERKKRSA